MDQALSYLDQKRERERAEKSKRDLAEKTKRDVAEKKERELAAKKKKVCVSDVYLCVTYVCVCMCMCVCVYVHEWSVCLKCARRALFPVCVYAS